jgi:hypothetical protein
VPCLYVVLRKAKTRHCSARVQHVRIVSPGLICAAFAAFGALPPQTQLFACGQPDRVARLNAWFASSLRTLGVNATEAKGFTLAGLRAGGITALFRHTGNLPLVKWRGRWDSAQTMEHYIQELEGSDAYASVPAEAREDLQALSGRLPSLLPEPARGRAWVLGTEGAGTPGGA